MTACTSKKKTHGLQVVVHQPQDNLHQQLLQMLSPPRIAEQAGSQTSSPMSNKEDSPEPNWGDFSSRPQQQGYHNELDNSFSGLKLGLDNRVPSSVTIRYMQQQSVICNGGSLAPVSNCKQRMNVENKFDNIQRCNHTPDTSFLQLQRCYSTWSQYTLLASNLFSSASPTSFLVNCVPNSVIQ